MGKKRYSLEFKQLIEKKLRAGVPVSQLDREYEPSVQTLFKWKRVRCTESFECFAKIRKRDNYLA